MKIPEDAEVVWQHLVKTYVENGEEGKLIIQFTQNWADRTEKIYDVPDVRHVTPTFRQALDSAFLTAVVLESYDDGRASLKANSDMVREALFLLTQAWEYADTMVACLTHIELNLLETAISMKVQFMQDQAAHEADEKEKT